MHTLIRRIVMLLALCVIPASLTVAPAAAEVRPATPPPIGVLYQEYGVYSSYSDDIRFGRYDGRYDQPMVNCFQGYMDACDWLFFDADELLFDDPPRKYGYRCGGRISDEERGNFYDAGYKGCVAIADNF